MSLLYKSGKDVSTKLSGSSQERGRNMEPADAVGAGLQFAPELATAGASRRGFLKAGLMTGLAGAANLSIGSVTNKVLAAAAQVPYKLLDLSLLGSLNARIGAQPTVMNFSSGASVSPTYGYAASGNAMGILARHAGDSDAGDGSDHDNSAAPSDIVSFDWDDLDSAAWRRLQVPTCVPNAGLAADGVNRLWRLREGYTNDRHMLRQDLPGLQQGEVHTLNAIVKSPNVRYVGLQLRTCDNKYYMTRFDLMNKSVYRRYGAVSVGLEQLSNGLVHIWASSNTGYGNRTPAAALMFLSDANADARFKGSDRTLYVSDFWASRGDSQTALPYRGDDSAGTPSGGELLAPADLNDSAWTKANVNLLANAGTASDGTNRLWRIRENTQNGQHAISQDLADMPKGSPYTVNAVVRSGQVQHVALQMRTASGNFHIARFDLYGKEKGSAYRALDYGVIPLSDGLVQIWASFDAEAGQAVPKVWLMMLNAAGNQNVYTGSTRSLYFSEMWMNSGRAATLGAGAVAPQPREPVAEGSNGFDVISVDGIQHMSPNNCAGILSFQHKSGVEGQVRLWHTGYGENDYAAVSLAGNQLKFEKVVAGVAARCVHTVSFQAGKTYKVGWRSSRVTGMELVLNGQQVATNGSACARRDVDVGDRLILGSNGRRFFSNCPIGGIAVYSEA